VVPAERVDLAPRPESDVRLDVPVDRMSRRFERIDVRREGTTLGSTGSTFGTKERRSVRPD
jgi:hypothetical protein